MCKILKGGVIGNGKTVQLLDNVISFPIISKQDSEDIKLASKLECDFIIVNQTRNSKMVRSVRTELKRTGSWMMMIHSLDLSISK